jgi:hypothetical protein
MRKILIAFLATMLLVLTLGTSTFAWITLARASQIESIAFQAFLGDSLEISIDGEKYYSELPATEISKIFGKNRLLDITSVDGKTFTHLRRKEITPNNHYISIEFYFRTTSKRERTVYLANNISDVVNYDDTKKQEGTFVVSKGINYRARFDFQYDENDIVRAGEVRTYYISEAVRISTISTINGEEVVKIFDLSGNEHRGYGKPYGAYDYYKKATNRHLELPTEIPPTIYELSKFDPNGPFSLDDISKLVELNEIQEFDGKTYYTGKIKMNIWVDGWDADLFDPVLYDRIKIQLQFKTVRN